VVADVFSIWRRKEVFLRVKFETIGIAGVLKRSDQIIALNSAFAD